MNFYELQGPTVWVDPPSTWSSTLLDDVDGCPRRWQLLRSRWGDFDRFPVRPHPAAIEGHIIHEALDRLTRACGQRGNPPFDSSEFRDALADAVFFPGFAQAVGEWQERLTSHPRPGPAFRMRVSAEDLANRAVRMFREQYRPNEQGSSRAAERISEAPFDLGSLLKSNGALSEVKLSHPTLPFMGILDRVQHSLEGCEIIDFKTGKPNEKHRQQLLRYALLWWRKTGETPVRLTVQYLDGVESWPVTRGALEATETDLLVRLPRLTDILDSRPAVARPGVGCHSCAVRARCDAGWAVAEGSALDDGHGDAQLVVKAMAGDHGFLATSSAGAEIAVVYEAAVAKLLPELVEGQVLRILSGVWKEMRAQLEIKAWTEVFVVTETS